MAWEQVKFQRSSNGGARVNMTQGTVRFPVSAVKHVGNLVAVLFDQENAQVAVIPASKDTEFPRKIPQTGVVSLKATLALMGVKDGHYPVTLDKIDGVPAAVISFKQADSKPAKKA